ncbi:MAG: hypothetical protein CMB96_04820 [Flavobacteriaceae bacterium]|nr:hypothetical protein [Flavobacteriaceae bacterium]|tara:strand:- start:1100 stop:2191 length:1092 start_codon:yes stop_codon:yes gene_type:complete
MTKMLQLSENLYPIDEVIGTFIQCLVSRAEIEETIFWLWELLYSSPDIADGLICIYKMFYSTNNCNIGRFISRKVNEYKKTNDNRLLADIVVNLRNIEPNFLSYMVNYYGTVYQYPTSIYKSKTWMEPYPQNMKNVFGSLMAHDYKNLGYYLAQSLTINGYDKTYIALSDFGMSLGINIDDGIDLELRTKDMIDLSSFVSRIITAGNRSPRSHFLRCDKSLVEEIDNHFTKKSEKYYLKLTERRLYATHPIVPPGDYGRYSVENLTKSCGYSWEYYAYESVEWNKRFRAYKGEQNHEKKSIDWPDDNYLEEFYEDDNAMDFDEQPSETQIKSLHDIYVCQTAEEWINKMQEIRLTKSVGEMKI